MRSWRNIPTLGGEAAEFLPLLTAPPPGTIAVAEMHGKPEHGGVL